MSRLVVMIRHNLEKKAEMLARLDQIGTRLDTVDVASAPGWIFEAQYAHHKGEPFYLPMIQDLDGRPIVLALYEGDQQRFMQERNVLRSDFLPEPHPAYTRKTIHMTSTEKEFQRAMQVVGELFKVPT